ncbi:MAG: hypothetical protein JWN17_937 [Frankiales bacterium]|nr:hypothetical protein [Frankiales bacterium]
MTDRSSPGVPAVGAVVLALGLGLAGGLFDVLTGPGLRVVFAVCFVLGCTLAALVVRRDSLGVAVVLPPLSYAVIALVAGGVQGTGAAGGFLERQALQLFTALVLEAPALLTATGIALVIALARGLGRRRTVREDAPQSEYAS